MVDAYQYVVDKYNLHVGRQHYVEIPNMGRDNMAKVFAELKFDKGAEVGVERGYYSEVLCRVNPNLHLYAIDPWSTSAYEDGIDAVDYDQSKYDERYSEAVHRLKPYNCTLVRKKSLDAAEDFEDESLDFVYIDANHDFVNFTNDLHTWKKKVRKGGIVSGHDYANFSYKKFNHVKRALEAYAKSYRMIPIFIVGSHNVEEGQARDKFRSWFWVKDSNR